MMMNFKITNITCDACVKLSTAALKSLPGVNRVEIAKDGAVVLESKSELAWTEVEDALAKVDKKAVLI